MEVPNKIISEAVPTSEPLLGPLTLVSTVNYQARSEPGDVSTGDVGHSDSLRTTSVSPLGRMPVPEGHGEIGRHEAKLVAVKTLAALYGLNTAAIYGFIKTDPAFPYRNVGLKKKYMIDVSEFEIWLEQRAARERNEHFQIPTAQELLERYRK